MCSMLLPVLCPLCAQPSFDSIDALRTNLIKAANGPLPCPICNELFLGLDKLTIHLFSHTSLMQTSTNTNTNTTNGSGISVPNAQSGGDDINAQGKTTAVVAATPSIPAVAAAIATIAKGGIMTLPASNTATATSPRGRTRKNTTKKGKSEGKSNHNECIAEQPPPTPNMNSPHSIHMVNIMNNNNNNHHTGANEENVEVVSNLAICDICELTFRNDELRDMHFRLIHRAYPTLSNNNNNNQTSRRNSNTDAGAFKCHLCPKTFKMKGSLRVHLRVVHFLGAPNSNATTICDRIRHQQERMANASQHQSQQVILTNSCSQPPGNTFSIGTLTLLPATSSLSTAVDSSSVVTSGGGISSIGASSLLKLNGEIMPAMETIDSNGSKALTQNVLLLFNPTSVGQIANKTEELLLDQEAMGRAGSTCIDTNPKIWECDICSKAFTTKYFLKKHKRLHTGEMPYTCEICSRTFTFQQSYHKHLLYHSDEKPHVCATCGRAFKELSTLHNHERIHSGEKPFKCEVCGKCFRQRVSFLVHTRIHTGVMPYKCEQCQKSFRYKVSQRTHKCIQKLSTNETNDDMNSNNAGDNDSNSNNLTENFIKVFLANSNNCGSVDTQQPSPASMEIANINAHHLEMERHQDAGNAISGHHLAETEVEALLSKTIDDIVVESCHKMGIGRADAVSMPPINANTFNQGPSGTASLSHCRTGSAGTGTGAAITITRTRTDDTGSPSEKLQNMRLYSPPQQQLLADLDGIANDNADVVTEGNAFSSDSIAFLPHFLLDVDESTTNASCDNHHNRKMRTNNCI